MRLFFTISSIIFVKLSINVSHPMSIIKPIPLYIILFFSIITNALAQKDAYFFIGGDLGGPVSKYQNNKNTLTNRWYDNHVALTLSGQYRLWNRLGFEGGIGQHTEYLAFKDNQFSSRNNGFVTDITSSNSFLNAFGAVQILQPLNSTLRLFVGGGYSLNWVTGAKNKSKTTEYIAGQESITLSNSYFNNTSIYGEIGFEGTLANDNVLSLALKYNIGQSAMMSGDYSVTKNGSTLEQDNVTSMGTYIGLTLKYGINFFHKEKDLPKPKPLETAKKEVPPVKTPPAVVTTPPKQEKEIKVKPPKVASIPTTVDGRAVSVTKKITVKKSEVVVKVWDHEVVDGDIVSLNLNGKWILQNYTLEKAPKEILVKLQPGTNYLVLHAHNLGKYSPNTAAVTVFDGTKENTIILKSTLNASGTVQIDLK